MDKRDKGSENQITATTNDFTRIERNAKMEDNSAALEVCHLRCEHGWKEKDLHDRPRVIAGTVKNRLQREKKRKSERRKSSRNGKRIERYRLRMQGGEYREDTPGRQISALKRLSHRGIRLQTNDLRGAMTPG